MDLAATSALLRLLSDPTRVRLLALLEREELTVAELSAVLRLAQPLDWNAVDDAPVDVIVALLSPPDAGADHLKALSRVSRLLRDEALLAKLRGAGSPDAVWALLTADEHRDAA